MQPATFMISGVLLATILSAGCQRSSTAEDFNGAWRGTETAITSTAAVSSQPAGEDSVVMMTTLTRTAR